MNNRKPEGRVALPLALAALCVLGPWQPLRAQASPDLEPGSAVELVIEKLVGFGLIEDRLVGLRPWSVDEARRLVETARRAASGSAAEAAAGRWLTHSALQTLDIGPRLDGALASINVEGRHPAVSGSNGTGGLSAVIVPLAPWQGGRPVPVGHSVSGELSARSARGPLAWSVAGGAWIPGSGGSDADAILLNAAGYIDAGPVRLGIGRSPSVWGHGRDGGTLLADRARGLDRIGISNESPSRLPGFLGHIGPTRGELFLARTEDARDIPHSVIVGYTLTARPHPIVEATVSAMVQSGGEGGPAASWGERIADHLILIDGIINGGHTFLFSNKGTSLALRLRVPQWRNAQFHAEHTIEDPASNLERLFWQHAGWHLGAWLPRLDQDGRLDLRAEWHHGGAGLHRHSQYSSGRTLAGRILGLGQPDTEEFLIELGVSEARSRFTLELGLVDRSADEWVSVIRPTGGLDKLDRVVDYPDERWLRAIGSVRLYGYGRSDVLIRIGGMRVANRGGVDGWVSYHRLMQLSARMRLSGQGSP